MMVNMPIWPRRISVLALAACCPLAQAQPPTSRADPAGPFDLQLSMEWSRGRYGEPSTTRVRQTGLTARYRGAGWRAEVEVPWVRVDNDLEPASLPGTVGGSQPSDEGLGDVWLKLTRELLALEPGQTGLDVTLKHKTRTGSLTRGLGTGGRDWALQFTVSSILPNGSLVFGHAGYRRTGDVSGYRPYRDPVYGEVGAQHRLTSDVDGGLYYSVREAIGRLGPVSELTTYVAWRHEQTRLTAYLTRGFAPASPEWAFGMMARQRF